MGPKSLKLLEDMRDAADDIAAFTRGRSFGEYAADKQFRWSVERGFEIIGEALSQLQKVDPATAQRITDYRKIVSFRNILIHGYAAVNHGITWDIVQTGLPALRKQLNELLQ